MRRIDDRAILEAYFRRAAHLHVYELGDLDPAEIQHSTFYALGDEASPEAVLLVYRGLSTPTVLAITGRPLKAMAELLQAADPHLPDRFYAHLTVGLDATLSRTRRLRSLDRHLKMALVDERALDIDGANDTIALGPQDAEELERFYVESHPDCYFERSALERGVYVGLRDGGGLACVAGVHAFSRVLRVAALGNVATRPDRRGAGLARIATASLCRQLLRWVDKIGLNVQKDNVPAIACYRRVGFDVIAEYDELVVER